MAAKPAVAAAAAAAATADDDDDDIEQLQYKIVLLGDGAVGASKMLFRLLLVDMDLKPPPPRIQGMM